MKSLFVCAVLILSVGFALLVCRQEAKPDTVWTGRDAQESIQVFFSPNGGCAGAITHELDNAKDTILVQAYSFTSVPIGEALDRAIKRRVRVSIIIDNGAMSDKYCIAMEMARRGATVMADAKHAISHNKVMVIDGQVVLTGSYNFTDSAERRNAENLLVIRNQEMAKAYEKNWRSHAEHSIMAKP